MEFGQYRKMRKNPYTQTAGKRGKNHIRNSAHDGRSRRERKEKEKKKEKERKKRKKENERNATNGGTAVRIGGGGGGEVAYNNMLIAEDRGRHTRTFRRIKRVKYGTAAGRTRLQRLTPPDRHAGTDQSHRPTGHRQHSSTMPSTRRERNPEGEIPPLHQFVFLLSVLHQRRRYHIPLDN